MAGDYTRCLWPMTSHGVYGRRLHTVTMGFDYTWYLMTATTHGDYDRRLWPVTTRGVNGR